MAVNSGVGPAKIQSVDIQVDGRPVRNPDELLAACCAGRINTRLLTPTLLGRMLRAGDTITYLDFGEASDTDVARNLMTAYNAEHVVVTVCYCSVFDECWTQTSRATARPKPVEVCPMPEPQYRY